MHFHLNRSSLMNPTFPSPSATSALPISLPSRRGGRNQRSRNWAVLALAATVLSSVMISAAPARAATLEATPATSAGHSELDAALKDVVAAGVPGIVVRVQDAHSTARDYTAGGDDLTTGTALRPGAKFRIGSITKTFVATIILQLVGEGRLSLDEPVAQRLPRLLRN